MPLNNTVIALDGVGGTGIMPQLLKLAVKVSGSKLHVQRYFWTHGYFRPFHDLRDKEHIERKAEELAGIIRSVKAESNHVQIIAKSGGCLVAVKALEQLDANETSRIILMSPAISPQYDLSPALRAVSGKMVCFHSQHDKIILGLGTTIFGTSDGVRTVSAGCVGFANPPDSGVALDQYDKLEQHSWTPSMLKQLHTGLHSGNSSFPWILKHIVPILAEGADSAEAI